ncbi:MAG TPA: hypothetical protein PLE85_09765 [Bacteroidales bacterium]|nr:hypothetical protein [Bacteroidales bacterium]
MDSFLINNRQKLGFAFKVISLIFLTTIATIILIMGFFKNQIPDIGLLLTIILSAGLVLPIFIIGLAYLKWLNRTRIRKRIYSTSPLDRLEEIGFTKLLINSNTKWYFTEEIKSGQINDFQVLCNGAPRIIEFTALTEPLCLDQNEYKDLKARLKQDSLYPNFEGITKQYCLGQLRVLSIEQIKLDLEQLTDILKREEIKPRIKNGGALHRI